jgi:EpsD family peptidyl-prolyl cis-trans isomerase
MGPNPFDSAFWNAPRISDREEKSMNLREVTVATTLACLGLAACHFPGLGGDAPTGEIAARVEGKDITVSDLRAEIAGAKLTDPRQIQQAEQQALQQIIVRTVLAKAAQDEGIDKTSDFAVAKKRAIDNLLAQSLEAKLAASVPAPTRQEADGFMSSHPDIFADRKVFDVDQIRMAPPSDPRVFQEIRPLKNLDDIIAVLNHEQIKFNRSDARLDAVGADPQLIEEILKLPPHALFILPSNGLLTINQLKDTAIQPFTGDAAETYAISVLRRQHTREVVQRAVGELIARQAKAVRYNKAFQPASPSPGAQPA